MKKKTFIVQLLDSKKPSKTSFTQVEDANFYSNDTDASLVFIPHEDTFDFQSAKVVMFNRDDESLVERDAVVTTENGRKVASYELPEEIISHWGQWLAQPVFIKDDGEIYSGAIVLFSVERYLMQERTPKLTEVVTVTEFVERSQELVNAMIQAEAQRITEEQDRQSAEAVRVQAENERSGKYESYAQQFNDVITDLSEEKDYHSLPEIAGARGGFDTLGDRLNNTRSKSVRIGLNDVDSEVLSAIEGGAGTEFNLLSQPQPNSVGVNETKYLMAEGVPSKNLFDKTAVTPGYYVTYSNGTLVPSTSYNVSDWIPVVPNEEYILHRPNNTANDIAFYSERNEESYVSGISVASEPFTVPANVQFLRMSVANIFLDLQMLEKGTVKSSYENGFPKVTLNEKQNYKINNSLLQRSIIESSIVGGAGANSGAIDFTNKGLIRRVGTPHGTGTGNGAEIHFTHSIDGQLLKGDTIRVFVKVETSEGMFPRGVEDYDFRLIAVENGVTIQNIRQNIMKTSNNLTYTISGEYGVKSSSESIRPVFTLRNNDVPTTEQTLTVTDVWYEVDSHSEVTGSSKVLNDLIRESSYPLFENGNVDEINTIGKDILNIQVDSIYNTSIGIEKKNALGDYYNHYFVSNATGVNNSKAATRGVFQVDVSDTDRVKLTKTMSANTATVEAVYSLGGSKQVPYESKRSPMILSGIAQKEKDLNRIVVHDYTNNTLYATVVDDGQNILQTSNDLGGTFEPKYTFTDDVKRALTLDNGNVLVLLKDGSLWVSTDNMLSFTNNMVLTDESPHESFGFSKYKNIVTMAPYAPRAQGSTKGKRAYVSYDSGETFTEMFNLLDYTDINQTATHIHSSTYDPYEDMFWVCVGDGQAQQMVYYSKDGGESWHRAAKQGDLEFQPTIIIPLRNSVLFVSDTRLVGVVRYVRPVGGTMAGSELKFDQPLIIAENWGSGSMDVPIASTPYIDWEKSIAYFSWIVTSGGDPGRQTAIGNKLLNGEVWTTNGDDFKLIYKRTEPERVNNIYGIFGGGDRLISRSHYSVGEILDTSDVWQ